MSLHCLRVYFLIVLNNIPLFIKHTIIYLPKDILAASSLAVMNKISIKICVQVFVWAQVFNYIGLMWSKIDGSFGKSMFSFLRKLSNHLQSGCIILYSLQQEVRVPVAPYPLCILAILIGMLWCLTIILICISLIRGVKYISIYLRDISGWGICSGFLVCF